MSSPSRPSSAESASVDNGQRKRVCKACDRCRLKKSKCDGTNPCSRCRADNAICVFGQRKKSHDKVYPKGYVEMLERQQAQLVTGLQEMYRLLQSGQGWIGAPLEESAGHPLTHDILERLGALQRPENGLFDGADEVLMPTGLPGESVDFTQTHELMEFEPDYGPSPSISSSFSTQPQQQFHFNDHFVLDALPPTPPNQSPYPQQQPVGRQLKRKPNLSLSMLSSHQTQRNMHPEQLHRSWHTPSTSYDMNCFGFPNQYSSPLSCEAPAIIGFSNAMPAHGAIPMALTEWQEPVDLDFSAFINQGMA